MIVALYVLLVLAAAFALSASLATPAIICTVLAASIVLRFELLTLLGMLAVPRVAPRKDTPARSGA